MNTHMCVCGGKGPEPNPLTLGLRFSRNMNKCGDSRRDTKTKQEKVHSRTQNVTFNRYLFILPTFPPSFPPTSVLVCPLLVVSSSDAAPSVCVQCYCNIQMFNTNLSQPNSACGWRRGRQPHEENLDRGEQAPSINPAVCERAHLPAARSPGCPLQRVYGMSSCQGPRAGHVHSQRDLDSAGVHIWQTTWQQQMLTWNIFCCTC